MGGGAGGRDRRLTRYCMRVEVSAMCISHNTKLQTLPNEVCGTRNYSLPKKEILRYYITQVNIRPHVSSNYVSIILDITHYMIAFDTTDVSEDRSTPFLS
jgi:hypothetical protein